MDLEVLMLCDFLVKKMLLCSNLAGGNETCAKNE